jgi:hypothetical protein
VAIDQVMAAHGGNDGTFTVRGIPSGTHTVHIMGPEFATKTIDDLNISADVDLGSLTVDRGRSVRGRVVDANGNGVGGAAVVVAAQLVGDSESLVGRGTHVLSDDQSTVTAADGAFSISGVGSSRRVIAAEHTTLGRSVPMTLDFEAAEAPLTLQLAKGGAVVGRILSNGSPLEGVLVVVMSGDSAAAAPAQTMGNVSGADGSYRISNVPPGHYRMIATRTNAKADFDFSASGVTLIVKSQVTSPQGEAVGVALLGGSPHLGTLEPPGVARLTDVEPGEYSICLVGSSSAREGAGGAAPHCSRVIVGTSPDPQSFEVN